MQSITNIARPKIDVFMRLPQFSNAGQVKVVASRLSALTAPVDDITGHSKLVYATGRASKVQRSCALVPVGSNKDSGPNQTPCKVKRSSTLRPFRSSIKGFGSNNNGSRSLQKRHCNGRPAGNSLGAEPGLNVCLEDYIDFGEFDDLDEEFLLRIAEQDPRVQALLDAGDESDSSVTNDNSDTEGPRPDMDLELWDHVCAAIWPDDV